MTPKEITEQMVTKALVAIEANPSNGAERYSMRMALRAALYEILEHVDKALLEHDDFRAQLAAVEKERDNWAQHFYKRDSAAAMAEAERDALKAWTSEVEVTDAARDVIAERERQQSEKGWTVAHDDDHENHGPDDLALAAVCYALPKAYRKAGPLATPELWPWSYCAWRPKDRRRDLVRAGALILAEIERLDRAALKAQEEGV
jgi:hypothetical protein